MALIYIPCKDRKEAKDIARHLLNKRLIACANFTQVESMYWWKGKIEDDIECLILAKGFDFKNIKKEVEKLHSYEVPAIIKIETEENENYSKWAKNETKS